MTVIDPSHVSIEDIDDLPAVGAGGAPVTPTEPRSVRANSPVNAGRSAPSIRQAVRGDLAKGRAKAREAASALEASVRAEPVRAAALAAGAGVLLGLLLSR